MTATSTATKCNAQGCIQAASQCSYVDRRGIRCQTAWCWDHGSSADGEPYCRRHAATIQSVGEQTVSGYPEVDNRAASLVGWIGRAIDGDICNALQSIAPEASQLHTDFVRLNIVSRPMVGRSRRWSRTWKLLDHTGILCTVSVEADESEPDEVWARVDGVSVGHGVPPWISLRGTPAGRQAEIVETQRHAYYVDLVSSLAGGLKQFANN